MITEHEIRIKAAIDRALEAENTDATCDVNDLLDLLDAVHAYRQQNPRQVSSLAWSSQKPTVPGWYWYRQAKGFTARCVEVYRDGGFVFFQLYGDKPQLAGASDGEFAGPIPAPH